VEADVAEAVRDRFHLDGDHGASWRPGRSEIERSISVFSPVSAEKNAGQIGSGKKNDEEACPLP
jgi:hypothetical protein